MPGTFQSQLIAAHARDAPYDIVLLAHVLAALVGFGTIVVAGVCALALRQRGPSTESLRRYYRPGINWTGRILFLVPVLGIALILMSQGDWSFSDAWVTIGLMLWAAVALTAEMVLWPAERRLQTAVGDPASTPDLRKRCAAVAAVAGLLALLQVAAAVVMVAKP
ncbi:MAG: DUF2269 family protein [Acidimicrobiales bacterium]